MMETPLLRLLSSPDQLKEECEQFLTKERALQEERGVGLVNFLKSVVRAAYANRGATCNLAKGVLESQRELRIGVTALKSDMQEMLDHHAFEVARDCMTILETVSESSNRQDGREESLRQENAALKCAFEDKERQVKRLQEEINQLKSEAAQGSTALSDLRLEKLQLLERAEAFEHLLEERSQYLVDTTFSFEQQAIKHQLTISKLEDELWDANQKAAFLRGKVRSGVEELESNCRRLWRLELTLQSLTIFLKWQADVTQQESCKTRELENTIYQMSSALHQKVEDEAEQNQKMLLLREELQNQKSRSANLEERMQLVEESHRTTRKHLDQKEAQLLLTLEKLEDAKKLIRIQEIEAKRIDLKLRDTQERLDRANLQFEEKIREHEKHAEVCKNLTRGNIARGADEIASTSTSISKKEELDTSSQSEVLELENGDESASRFSRTEAVNESNTLASCFKSISSTCEAKALKEKNESYAESPKRSNIAPKGLSAWIDEEYDALAITSTDDEDSQSNLWLEFDAARDASKRGLTAEKLPCTGAPGPPHKKLRTCSE